MIRRGSGRILLRMLPGGASESVFIFQLGGLNSCSIVTLGFWRTYFVSYVCVVLSWPDVTEFQCERLSIIKLNMNRAD